ncbi:unnamed protein product [Parajaminaea phylloscopi]
MPADSKNAARRSIAVCPASRVLDYSHSASEQKLLVVKMFLLSTVSHFNFRQLIEIIVCTAAQNLLVSSVFCLRLNDSLLSNGAARHECRGARGVGPAGSMTACRCHIDVSENAREPVWVMRLKGLFGTPLSTERY